ncbi:unnamed protein product [Euphydryas editha]|uniref:PiggyBac transposable element-derived protein domain-containing protein n=1 Tax=Euphydryas editha TaxID=104508 RepID=A0AAU9TPW5_EUPED|nr:unnamed protein product [Euphydryas editha]
MPSSNYSSFGEEEPIPSMPSLLSDATASSSISLEMDKLKEKDIEFYLAQLEDGWLSEDGQDVENSDEEQFQEACYTREKLEDILQDDIDNEDDPGDPPLVEEHMEVQKNSDSFPSGSISDRLLDKRNLVWKKRFLEYDEDKIVFLGNSEYPLEISELETPYQCFMYFFDEVFIQKIVDQTNLYSTQKDPNNSVIYNVSDMKKFFGILLYMSVQKFPSTRSYWSPTFGYGPISCCMPVNKFEKLKLSLHFQNNDTHKPVGHPEHDRLFKIRPVIEHLNEKFSSIPMEQRLSVDEQMCATKVAHFLKQYLPNKPHKWNPHLWGKCNVNLCLNKNNNCFICFHEE